MVEHTLQQQQQQTTENVKKLEKNNKTTCDGHKTKIYTKKQQIFNNIICLFKKLLFTMENATAADSSQSNISRLYIWKDNMLMMTLQKLHKNDDRKYHKTRKNNKTKQLAMAIKTNLCSCWKSRQKKCG